MVTQMSKAWIESRLLKAVKSKALAETIASKGYSRHVLFFAAPQAVSHAEAVIRLTMQQTVPHSFHAAHDCTREWTDNQISQVVNDRAGIAAAQRRSR
jgi:hypothetical protein